MLVSFHQVSQDGGLTWSNPAVITSISLARNLTAQTMDTAGRLYFLQLVSNDKTTILNKIWNGSNWISEEPKELYINDRVVPSSITTTITSNGNLLLSVLVDYPYLSDGLKNDLLTVGKSLELPEVTQTPYAAIIPSVQPTHIAAEATSAILLAPTPDLPVASSNKFWLFLSGNKNLVGFLLLGGILIMIVVVFRPLSRKR